MRAKNIVHMSIAAAAAITANGNGAGVDISPLAGDIKVTLDSNNGGAADDTLDVKLQHSDDNITFVDVLGGAFTQVTNAAAAFETLTLNVDGMKKYLRAVDAVAGTAHTFSRAVSLIGEKQYS